MYVCVLRSVHPQGRKIKEDPVGVAVDAIFLGMDAVMHPVAMAQAARRFVGPAAEAFVKSLKLRCVRGWTEDRQHIC